jgi:hypothetical protein
MLRFEMHLATASLALGLALLCGGCALPQPSVGAAQPDYGWGPWTGGDSGWRTYPGYGDRYGHGSGRVCDHFGRCWHPGYDHDPDRVRSARPPDWADDLPESAQERRRFVRPDDGLVCDQVTRVCYKQGNVDKSDTKEFFGRRAAKRADRLRDERGSAEIFVPEPGVACDPQRERCFADGEPDRDLTKRHFGRRAGRKGG